MATALRWMLVGLGAATFLVAAKAHGRQLRLERELAGHFQVIFGARNDPFVEALWRRERWIFWGVALSVALATAAWRAAGWRLPLEGGVAGGAVLHVLVPTTIAFVAGGLLSAARLAESARTHAAPSEAWRAAAQWGSTGWWAVTFVMLTTLVALAWRR